MNKRRRHHKLDSSRAETRRHSVSSGVTIEIKYIHINIQNVISDLFIQKK